MSFCYGPPQGEQIAPIDYLKVFKTSARTHRQAKSTLNMAAKAMAECDDESMTASSSEDEPLSP